MQKNKKRKGFTLTELAIVIAVIAILIAVLVPTFVSLLNKANDSADEQAVKSMNTSLAAAEAIDGKPDSPAEAMAVLKADGFNVENYVALDSGNTIYYDSSYNRCLIWTVGSDGNGSITYPSEMISYYPNATGVAANWYTFASIYDMEDADVVEVTNDGQTTLASVLEDIEAGDTVIVKATTDITLDSATVLSGDDDTHVTLDLNEHSLTLENVTNGNTRVNLVKDSEATLYIKNGTIESEDNTTSNLAEFKVNDGCSLTLENVTYETTGSGLYPEGKAAQVNVINSTIIAQGQYGIATNANNVSNYGVLINISGSYIESKMLCGVCMNTGSTLNISDSEIIGVTQGLFVRAGTATITNTKISASIDTSNSEYFIDTFRNYTNGTTTWGSGNSVAYGAVVVGNWYASSAYKADAVVTLSGCTLSFDITGTDADDYSQYEISLYMIQQCYNSNDCTDDYQTTVEVSGGTINNKVVNFTGNDGRHGSLTGYTGTVYTTWSTDQWTTGS